MLHTVHILQVHTSEGLSKLVSDLKEYLILNEFSTVNDSCTQHISELAAAQAQNQTEVEALYSQAAAVATAGTVNSAMTAQPQDLTPATAPENVHGFAERVWLRRTDAHARRPVPRPRWPALGNPPGAP